MGNGVNRYIPCSIGDTVWVIRSIGVKRLISQGIVREIMFIGEKMDLCIVVGHLARGRWGEKVFSSKQEAERALAKNNDPHFVSAAQVRAMTLDEVRERKEEIMKSLKEW